MDNNIWNVWYWISGVVNMELFMFGLDEKYIFGLLN